MGLSINGVTREITCDGKFNGAQCKASFSREGVKETVHDFIRSAVIKGWICSPKCLCPKCAETKQRS